MVVKVALLNIIIVLWENCHWCCLDQICDVIYDRDKNWEWPRNEASSLSLSFITVICMMRLCLNETVILFRYYQKSKMMK